jgi:copper chaperone CopZ
MIKQLSLGLLISFISTIGLAQVTPKAVRVNIATPDAVCEPCKAKIEASVPRLIDGIVKITVQTRQKITQVQYYPDRTNIEEIKTAISNAGFDADDVLANPDVYKKLPDCCKKMADQRNPKSGKM